MRLSILISFVLAATALASEPPGKHQSLDAKLQALINKWNIPGGSVAIERDGRPMYSKGIGMSDPATREPVRARALFRIASVSKPITATAVLMLLEEGRIRLDDRVLDWLPQYRSFVTDVRAHTITIRHLLQHAGGWDSVASGDPMYPSWEQLQSAGASIPPQQDEIIRYWLSQPLDFAPGTRYAYSNFGYVLLGRIIEAVTHSGYENWTGEHVLARAGIERPSQGGSLLNQRARGEVTYTDYPGAAPQFSVFSGQPQPVPAPYGSFSLSLQDSAGGWLASAPDLARFVSKLAAGKILRPETLTLMTARPSFVPADASSWYGLGFLVLPGPVGFALTHDGAFAGSQALVFHVPGVFTAAALFNSKPRDYARFLGEVLQLLADSAPSMKSSDDDSAR